MMWKLLILVHFIHAHAVHMSLSFSGGGGGGSGGDGGDLLATPCPDIFQYFVEDGEVKYGMLKVKSPEGTSIQLNVEISVGNNVQGYNGDLELGTSRAQTIDDILNRRSINYKMYFPRWVHIPPKVTKIILNGELICSGPPIDIKSVRVLTTINLQHTLKLNVPASAGEAIPPEKRVDQTTSNVNNINYQPQYHQPPQQPTIPAINFNPATPKDPTKIYAGNPFLNNAINTNTPPRINAATTPAPFLYEDALRRNGVNDRICGRSVNTNSLIAHGDDVQKGQYPWLVAIFIIKSLGPEFLCGGNLISHKHVITAAHCMKIANRILHVDKIFLRFGAHNIHQWTQVSESRSVGAARISVHPDYKPMSADADIALVTLHDEVEFTKQIRPVCVWAEDGRLERVVGEIGTVVGWGKDESNSLITPEPKQVNFPVVSQEDCLRSHFTFREITSERTFCAGFRNGSGPCNGDSGGGFLLQRDDRWTLRGIVSMSIAKDRSCDFSHYFVFSDIPKFMEWLLDSMKPF